jgi:Ran GTPase-activating protein (RanGAP) involved in mRNA processing and transport
VGVKHAQDAGNQEVPRQPEKSKVQVNTCVRTLDLADNYIGDIGAETIGDVLKVNTSIEYLDLADNHIRFAGCAALASVLAPRVSNLAKLFLRHNGIGDQECAALAKALMDNEALQLLDISDNHIGDRGAVALGAMLSVNAGLEVCIQLRH